MVDATDSIITSSNAQMVATDSLTNNDPLTTDTGRVSQQKVLPTSISPRLLGSIISSSHSGLGAGAFSSFSIPGVTSGKFDFTVADKLGRTILAIPDIAVYVNTLTAANQWPNATYGMGTLPITVFNNWGETDNVDTVTTVVVRNNTPNPVFVIVVCRWRIITNPVSTLPQANASSPQSALSSAQDVLGGRGGGY